MKEPIPFVGYVDIGEDMTLIEEATKLADDIDEYAPDTNIATMMRRLITEIQLKDAIIWASKNKPQESNPLELRTKDEKTA